MSMRQVLEIDRLDYYELRAEDRIRILRAKSVIFRFSLVRSLARWFGFGHLFDQSLQVGAAFERDILWSHKQIAPKCP